MPRKSPPPKPPYTPVGNVDSFTPTRNRPVRLRARSMRADTHVEPHSHPWAQLAYSATGIVQVTAERGKDSGDETTYIVPPSRAVWIAPGARHQITVLEAAELRTLYIDARAVPSWNSCRVLVVSPLLRETVQALDTAPKGHAMTSHREQLLSSLVLNELIRAETLPLGVPMPNAQNGDKRLRALCEAILNEPGERATLGERAADIGASERTVARLFREELGMSFQQWRQQVILAHALPLLARGQSVGHVAAAAGYASESAFTAMFKSAMGQPPSHFQRRTELKLP